MGPVRIYEDATGTTSDNNVNDSEESESTVFSKRSSTSSDLRIADPPDNSSSPLSLSRPDLSSKSSSTYTSRNALQDSTNTITVQGVDTSEPGDKISMSEALLESPPYDPPDGNLQDPTTHRTINNNIDLFQSDSDGSSSGQEEQQEYHHMGRKLKYTSGIARSGPSTPSTPTFAIKIKKKSTSPNRLLPRRYIPQRNHRNASLSSSRNPALNSSSTYPRNIKPSKSETRRPSMAELEQAQQLYDALQTLEKEQHPQTVFTTTHLPHIQLQPINGSSSKQSPIGTGTEKSSESASAASPLDYADKDPISRPRSQQQADDEKRAAMMVASNSSSTTATNAAPTATSPTATSNVTLWKYLLLELGSNNTQAPSEEKTEQLDNFVRLPFYLERVIIFGSLACFDSFLYIFTILPLRFCYAALSLVLRCFRIRREKIPLTRKIDIFKGIVLLVVLYLLTQLDTSKIYHGIRGQSAVKLYVMFNVLEIADKLCSALGLDILDCLFSANTLSISYSSSSLLFFIRPLFFTVLAILYVYIHSIVILYQIISLNVAVNSYSNALLTLLLSNQFSEIKSTVFKKFERENLFQLTCADVAERFQITIMMLVIGLRNVAEVSSTGLVPRSWSGWNRWLGALMGPMIVVVGSEVCVDWLKHAYIAKFNNIRPRVYRKFLDVLVYDYSDNSFSDQIMTKRIGIPIIPLASVFLRMLLQSYSILAEYQQTYSPTTSTTSSGASTASFLPTCSITSSIIINEMRKQGADINSNLSFPPFSTSLSSSGGNSGNSLLSFGILHSSSTSPNQNATWADTISKIFSSVIPYYFERYTQLSYYSCLYSSFRAKLSSCMPDSADSFYTTATMVLIVAISFILLFSVKLILGLFLLQYTSKRRAVVIAKSSSSAKAVPLQSQQPQHSGTSPGAGVNNVPPQPLGSAVPSATPTVPARARSSSQITYGSRRQSVSRSTTSVGTTTPALLTLASLPTAVAAPQPLKPAPSMLPTTMPACANRPGSSGSTSLAVAGDGYESDESDHVPGPIKGQGLVEVNEMVRERMYEPDEPVPPPKPRKTHIKDFKDLCKIQRFKMTAKQIW